MISDISQIIWEGITILWRQSWEMTPRGKLTSERETVCIHHVGIFWPRGARTWSSTLTRTWSGTPRPPHSPPRSSFSGGQSGRPPPSPPAGPCPFSGGRPSCTAQSTPPFGRECSGSRRTGDRSEVTNISKYCQLVRLVAGIPTLIRTNDLLPPIKTRPLKCLSF